MRISDWSSDVCSSDLPNGGGRETPIPAILIHRPLGLLFREQPSQRARAQAAARRSQTMGQGTPDMKTHAMASGLRITLTKTELQALVRTRSEEGKSR